MRVSSPSFHCPSLCTSKSSLSHYSPSPLSLEGAQHVSPSPTPVSIVVEKKLTDGKIEIERNGSDDGEKVEIILKSSLKKPAGSGSRGDGKGRVKWMDDLGKELVEVRELDPIESEELDSDDDGNPTCVCAIQ